MICNALTQTLIAEIPQNFLPPPVALQIIDLKYSTVRSMLNFTLKQTFTATTACRSAVSHA